MRTAFISDIHGSLLSLELVLADIKKSRVDQIVCLGDVASLGPQPREVIARLKELDIPIVQGNHDHYLLNPHLTKEHLPWLREVELWCHSLLTNDDRDFLRTFKPRLKIPLDRGTSIVCFHGSLRSNEEFIFPDTPASTLNEIFGSESAKLFIGGHSHVQMFRLHKEITLLNPGSVGMPFEYPMRGPDQHAFHRAEYMIIDMNKGKMTFDMRRIPMEYKQLEKISLASGMPNVKFWLTAWNE